VIELLLRFLRWCAPGTPRVIAGRNADHPYLTRYFLYPRSARTGGMEPIPGKTTSWGLYLQHFHRSDDDAALHNHRWKWALSLILKGGYSEERRVGDEVVRRTIKAGHFNLLKADTFHRVDLLDPVEGAWSLIFVGPIVQSWGFWDRGTKVFTGWREFIAKKFN
jgi:hypothetical protein